MTSLLFALLLLSQDAADWTRFRGPGGDGIAPASAQPPLDWSESSNVAWKTAIPGRGRSAPVVLGERIFVTRALERGIQRKRMNGDDMQTAEWVAVGAVCLDRASGRILWDVTLREIDAPEAVHFFNSWATPTPLVEPGRLYCEFGGAGTWCLDPETGKVLWEKRLPMDAQVGPASSPALFEGKLLLVRDGREAQYVAALDARSGEIVWKTGRPPIATNHGNSKKSFSSPLLATIDGKTRLVAIGPHWLVLYDPADGTELWRLRHGDGFSIGSVPVYGQGLIFAGTGCMRPVLLAVKPDGSGDVTASGIAWKSTKGIPVMSSPLLVGGDLYWVSDEGVASCAEAKSGTLRWQSRLGEGHLASPILAAGRVYFFGKEGKTTVVKPGEVFEKVAENKVDGVLIATPAMSGKAIYLRTDTHLYRIEAR